MTRYHARPVVEPSIWRGVTVGLLLEGAAALVVFLAFLFGLPFVLWLLS